MCEPLHRDVRLLLLRENRFYSLGYGFPVVYPTVEIAVTYGTSGFPYGQYGLRTVQHEVPDAVLICEATRCPNTVIYVNDHPQSIIV